MHYCTVLDHITFFSNVTQYYVITCVTMFLVIYMLGGYKEKKKKNFHFIFRTLALESADFISCSGAGKWWSGLPQII